MLILYTRKEEEIKLTNITYHTLHQSKLKEERRKQALHQNESINSWNAFLLNLLK